MPAPSLNRVRLYYFIVTGAGGFLIPFLSLFYQRQGMSGTQIGLLGTTGALAGLIAAPFWGRQSDRAADPRRLLQAAFLGSAVVYLLISQQDGFIWLAIYVCIAGILGAGVDPMSDAMTLDLLKGQEKTGFGSVRLWGSLGWALTVFVSGWLIERTNLMSAFWGYAILMVLTVLVLNWLDLNARKLQSPGQARARAVVSTRQVFGLIGRDRALVGLAFALSVLWLTRSGIYQFQAIYLDQLGAGESLIGLASTLGALVELPGMLIADHLIRQFGSHRVLSLMMLIYFFMFGIVVIFPTIPAILASAALGGITFSFYSVGIVVFLSERAPLGQTATILAIFSSTLRGSVAMVAGPLAGMVFDLAGAYWLYVLAVVGSLLAWLVFRMLVSGKRSVLAQR
jgi:PPP family 3-phenylpropionic acid transporter